MGLFYFGDIKLLLKEAKVADVQEATTEEELVQGEYMVPDELTEETQESTSEESEKTTETEEETSETSPPAEKEEPKGPYADYDRTQLEIQLDRETKEKNRVARELRQTLNEKKEPGALTKEQIVEILRENPNDPDVQFQVYDYIASEHAKKSTSDSIDAVKLSQTKAQTDKYVSDNYADLMDESKPAYAYAENLKAELGITNHPHANFLVGNAMVAMNYEKTLNEQYQRGLNEGQGKSVEKNRKKGIKEGKLESSNTQSKSAPVATSNMEEAIKILGLEGRAKDEYIQMMTKAKGGA